MMSPGIGAWLRRLSYLLRRSRHDADLREEIETHRLLRQADLEKEGVPQLLADTRSRQAMGNVLLAREEAQEAWLGSWMTWGQDLRNGVRFFRREPRTTAVAILTMAVGIGMTAAMFSVFQAVLLRPLAYPDPDRLIWVATHDSRFQRDTLSSRSDFLLWRARTSSLAELAAYGDHSVSMIAGSEARQERVTSITSELWNLTGARVSLGRLFGPGEGDVAVMAHATFARDFGADPAVLGTTVLLNGHAVTVVGVLAPDYRFILPPTGDHPTPTGLYIPLPNAAGRPGSEDPQRAGMRPAPPWIRVFGRLQPGVPIERATAALQRVYADVIQDYPPALRAMRETYSLRVMPLQQKLTGHLAEPLTILLVAVAFVFGIALVNIAHLLIAGALSRQSEVAVRLSLGAGPTRIIRQMLVECLLLAALGCGAGFLLAQAVLVAFGQWAPGALPRMEEVALDRWVLAFAVVAACGSALAFGVGPALALRKIELATALNGEGRASAPRAVSRTRALLVGLELAFATTLLIAAGLMMRSYWEMSSSNHAVDPDRILVTRVSLSGSRYAGRIAQEAYVDELSRRLDGVPGISAVGIDAGSFNSPVLVEGVASDSEPGGAQFAAYRPVSLGFLRTIGVPLLRGHWPSDSALGDDAVESTDAILVNQRFVSVIMRGQDPIGRHLRGPFVSGTVAGVVADLKEWQLDADSTPQIYVPFKRATVLRTVRLVFRADGDAGGAAQELRKRISAVDPTQAVAAFTTLQDVLASSVAQPRFNLGMLSVFGAVAFFLALTGTYGVIAHSIAHRRREIGIRVALGARPATVIAVVVRHEMQAALVGIGVGVMATLALSPVMERLLYGVRPHDPLTFIAAGAALTMAALLTSWRAAATVVSTDPLIVLQRQ